MQKKMLLLWKSKKTPYFQWIIYGAFKSLHTKSTKTAHIMFIEVDWYMFSYISIKNQLFPDNRQEFYHVKTITLVLYGQRRPLV